MSTDPSLGAEFKTAKEAFRRVTALIEESDLLRAQVAHIRYTTGEEGVELRDGSRLKFARSSGSGRGFTGDLIILDEAYNLSTDMMAALLPTMSARPNPQIWYTSLGAAADSPVGCCAGCASGEGWDIWKLDVLRVVCLRPGCVGRSSSVGCGQSRFGYPDHPEFVARELEALESEEFARERLGFGRMTIGILGSSPKRRGRPAQTPSRSRRARCVSLWTFP